MSPQQKAQLAARLERVAAERVKAQPDVKAHVKAANKLQPLADILAENPPPKAKSRSGSKNPPGYMTEYMRKRRAKQKETA